MKKVLGLIYVVLPIIIHSQTYEELIATPDLSIPPSQSRRQTPTGLLPDDIPPIIDSSPSPQNSLSVPRAFPNQSFPIDQSSPINVVTIEQPVYVDQVIEITNYITNDAIGDISEPPILELSNQTTLNIQNTTIHNVYTTFPLSRDIFAAVYHGRLDDVRMFIERRIADVNSSYGDGSSLLHLAAYLPQNASILEYLINQGADINKQNRLQQTPLHIAVLRTNLVATELLLRANAIVGIQDSAGQTPLWLSSMLGQSDMLKILAAAYQGQNIGVLSSAVSSKVKGLPNVPSLFELYNGQHKASSGRPLTNTPWHEALFRPGSQGTIDLIQRGLNPKTPDSKGQNALHIAAFYDNIPAAQYLLSQGVSVNSKDNFGGTALHIAAGRASVNMLRLLIQYGAGVLEKNKNGWTPLFEATMLGNTPAVAFFLQQGISPNTRAASGRTPLHEAARQLNNPDIFIALLDSGAVPNAADKDGITPLHIAAQAGNLQAAAQLLNLGAPTDIENREGLTPLHIAVLNGNVGFVKYLVERGEANIATTDIKGRSPLESAYARGDDQMTAYLASQYATIQAKFSTRQRSSSIPRPNVPRPAPITVTNITNTPTPAPAPTSEYDAYESDGYNEYGGY
ncbi:MAG: ankyrin repeat domain-containing protein [Brevinema sp.]